MAYYIKLKHVGQLTKKKTIQCNKMVLILCDYNIVAQKIYNVKCET